jgi:hypothetical protein
MTCNCSVTVAKIRRDAAIDTGKSKTANRRSTGVRVRRYFRAAVLPEGRLYCTRCAPTRFVRSSAGLKMRWTINTPMRAPPRPMSTSGKQELGIRFASVRSWSSNPRQLAGAFVGRESGLDTSSWYYIRISASRRTLSPPAPCLRVPAAVCERQMRRRACSKVNGRLQRRGRLRSLVLVAKNSADVQ